MSDFEKPAKAPFIQGAEFVPPISLIAKIMENQKYFYYEARKRDYYIYRSVVVNDRLEAI